MSRDTLAFWGGSVPELVLALLFGSDWARLPCTALKNKPNHANIFMIIPGRPLKKQVDLISWKYTTFEKYKWGVHVRGFRFTPFSVRHILIPTKLQTATRGTPGHGFRSRPLNYESFFEESLRPAIPGPGVARKSYKTSARNVSTQNLDHPKLKPPL